MKKTHSTNIGGRIFEVEEDAYQQLTIYLASITARFSAYPDAKDIVADVEARIAEHLLYNAGPSRIVTSEDVMRVTNAMGRADQFGDTAEVPAASRGTTSESTDTGTKHANFSGAPGTTDTPINPGSAENTGAFGIARPRLFRDRDERVIAGVASGIAAYFDVSPTWIRLLFLFSLFLGGTGFLAYLVLWVCVPPARTVTDRVRMRGERVTLNTIDQGLRDESLAPPQRYSTTSRTIFRILIACAVIVAILFMGMCIGALSSSDAFSSNEQWTYTSSSDANVGRRVRVDTIISVAGTPTVDLSAISGDIHVTTWSQSQVKVVASSVGNIGIDIMRTGKIVRIHEKMLSHVCRSCSTTIDVTVPQGTSVVSTTVSGSQTIAVLHGNVRVNTTSGDIEVDGAHTVTAKAVSGDVTVTLPDTAHVTIDARSVSGDIETDFSPEMNQESGLGRHVVIPVNGGGAHVDATTTSGDIAVRRKS